MTFPSISFDLQRPSLSPDVAIWLHYPIILQLILYDTH